METDKRYFLVGVFVLTAIIGILGFTVWLTASDKGNYVRYKIRFAESVSGLSVGGVVKFRGVNVGSVESIRINPKDSRRIRVDIRVQETTPIKTDTVASLKMQGITGIVFVELSGGSENAQDLKTAAKSGDVPEIKAQYSQLTAIVDRMPELLDRISNGVEQINKLMSDENVLAVTEMVRDGQLMMSDLREITGSSRGNISEAVNNLSRSSQQMDSIMRDLKRTSRNISNLSEDVSDNPSQLIFPVKEKGVPAP